MIELRLHPRHASHLATACERVLDGQPATVEDADALRNLLDALAEHADTLDTIQPRRLSSPRNL